MITLRFIFTLLGTPFLKEKSEILLCTTDLDNTVKKAIEGLDQEFYVENQKIEVWHNDRGYVGEVSLIDEHTTYRLQQELSKIVIEYGKTL